MSGLRKLKFFSHIHYQWPVSSMALKTSEKLSPGQMSTKKDFTHATVNKVRMDCGYPIGKFPELVHCVAQLGSRNTRLNLFFRGQNNDHVDREGKSKLYPSIFRPDKGKKILSKPTRQKRFAYLDDLVKTLRKNNENLKPYSNMAAHPEYWLALLQHYEICPTPLLDITQSLRVAATFALYNRGMQSFGEKGFVYVLGLPHLHSCISKYADDRLTIVKLQNVSPPQALRPHFQEGYLVGRWPQTVSKEAADNFAYWLVGKYLLDNSDGTFFEGDFSEIPYNALIPDKDPFREKLLSIVAAAKERGR
jgi:hypothetical protein